jgi:predicted nucleic acid-binding protein
MNPFEQLPVADVTQHAIQAVQNRNGGDYAKQWYLSGSIAEISKVDPRMRAQTPEAKNGEADKRKVALAVVMAAIPGLKALKAAGGTVAAAEKAAPRAMVVLDTNALVAAIEQGNPAVDAAIAGRQPVVPITAAKEFLVKGNSAALRAFLAARGGIIASAPQASTVRSMLAAGLKANDARVGAAAADLGAQLITRDKAIMKALPFAISF